MTRNLSHRIEVAVPIYDPALRSELFSILELQLRDDCSARVLDSALSNRRVSSGAGQGVRAQVELYRMLEKGVGNG
jgi:polyphosphate kinase